jgi:N-acetylmuramoyl-L-alanine amidase
LEASVSGNRLQVTGAAVEGHPGSTRAVFTLAGPAQVEARSLSDPPRVIVDLPEAEFRVPPGTGQTSAGLVARFRFGLIAPGRSRIVLDATAPVTIARAEVVGPTAGGTWRLEVDLVPATPADLAARELAEAASRAVQAADAAPEAARSPQARDVRPVIVVDPGHGGIDPGAEGAVSLEKQVVLDVSLRVREALQRTGRYDVVMTRDRDVFVSLDDRVRISQRARADLFLSIHADSLPSKQLAQNVRGATIYTLAEKASDELARRLAEKENAVDLLAGLPMAGVGDDHVRAILFDLMRRESATFAHDLRRGLVKELRSRIAVAREPLRSGPFKVLRQPGAPAVLIELGYMSNAQDERLMGTRQWQDKVAQGIAVAVGAHFRARPGTVR